MSSSEVKRKAEKRAEELYRKLLQSVMAKESAEGELKNTVEQRDKWERQAGQAGESKGEKEKLEKDLRQRTSGSQPSGEAGPSHHNIHPDASQSSTTQRQHRQPALLCECGHTGRMTGGRKDKGKGRAAEPAPTAAAPASAAEDIEMKDWSPYEDLSDYGDVDEP